MVDLVLLSPQLLGSIVFICRYTADTRLLSGGGETRKPDQLVEQLSI